MSEQVIYGKNIHPGAGLVESNMFIGPISRKRQSMNLRRSFVVRLTRLQTSDTNANSVNQRTLNTFSDSLRNLFLSGRWPCRPAILGNSSLKEFIVIDFGGGGRPWRKCLPLARADVRAKEVLYNISLQMENSGRNVVIFRNKSLLLCPPGGISHSPAPFHRRTRCTSSRF